MTSSRIGVPLCHFVTFRLMLTLEAWQDSSLGLLSFNSRYAFKNQLNFNTRSFRWDFSLTLFANIANDACNTWTTLRFDGSVQTCSNSIVNTLELLQFCTKPSIYETHLVQAMRHHNDVIKWKHFPRYWPFVRGIHRSPVNSPHKGQWRGALTFSLICVWLTVE